MRIVIFVSLIFFSSNYSYASAYPDFKSALVRGDIFQVTQILIRDNDLINSRICNSRICNSRNCKSSHSGYRWNWANPLYIASQHGHREIVELLLNIGAYVNSSGGCLHTPAILIAAKYGHRDIVELLLNRGADVNSRNSHRDTALVLAIGGGHREVVELLLNRGADMNLRNSDGETALELAVRLERREMVELLRNHERIHTVQNLWETTDTDSNGEVEFNNFLQWPPIEVLLPAFAFLNLNHK